MLLTTKEAAEMIGVQADTLKTWRWTGRYDLPFKRIGSGLKPRVRYDIKDVQDFIDKRIGYEA